MALEIGRVCRGRTVGVCAMYTATESNFAYNYKIQASEKQTSSRENKFSL